MNKPVKRERADKILVERGLAESRTRAQAMIMAGSVFIGEQRVDKPGDIIPIDADVVARGQ
ncbi:MAG: S4 domain-containing protein, partial [Pseudomonadota bacterium]|nr:S4 domain-containing protein [Pseudomonadota bacterium]